MSDDAAAKRRARQTVINLLLSLVACLGIVLVTVLAVPRDDSNRIQPVDYKTAAANAEAAGGVDVLAPELPQGWWANLATWNGTPKDGVKTWKIGFVGPKNQYVGVVQAFGVNPTFVALQTANFQPDTASGTESPNWTKWIPGRGTDADPHLWTYEYAGNLVVVTGTASPAELSVFTKLIEMEVAK